MDKLTRKELIDLIIYAINELEGQTLDENDFDQYSFDQLVEEAKWYNYLLDK